VEYFLLIRLLLTQYTSPSAENGYPVQRTNHLSNTDHEYWVNIRQFI